MQVVHRTFIDMHVIKGSQAGLRCTMTNGCCQAQEFCRQHWHKQQPKMTAYICTQHLRPATQPTLPPKPATMKFSKGSLSAFDYSQ